VAASHSFGVRTSAVKTAFPSAEYTTVSFAAWLEPAASARNKAELVKKNESALVRIAKAP
jgi:hypothetical protein